MIIIWVDFGPIIACLIHRVTRCRGYRGACVELPNPNSWQKNLSILKWDKLHKAQESAVSALDDIIIHQGDHGANQGVTGLTKIKSIKYLMTNAY